MSGVHILVTGGTGGLGREILPRLVQFFPGAEVTFLVRGPNRAAIAEREAAIHRYIHTYWPKLKLGRVRAIGGDVTRENLGLDEQEYLRLCHDLTHIVHGAASIGLDQPLDQARGVNVGGTHRVLSLAGKCKRLVRLAHVSTAFVAGTRSGIIREDEVDCGQDFQNAYEQSKFEAECLVRSRMDRFPITVFRPSIIVGDSRDGHFASFDTLLYPLRRLIETGALMIPGQGETQLDIVPVDFVADTIVRLLSDSRAVAGTYHVTAGRENTVSVRWVVNQAKLQANGTDRRQIDFLGRVHPATDLVSGLNGGDGSGGDLNKLDCFFAYLRGHKEFDDTGLRTHLGRYIRRRPCPIDYLPRVFAFSTDTNWGINLPWDEPDFDAMLAERR